MSSSSGRAAAVRFIFVTILLDAAGIGVLIPVFPDVLRRFSADPVFVSRMFGWFIGVYALMQFLASPVLGSLSDRFGRRPVLLVSLLGAACDYLFMAFAPTLPLLFLGRMVSGLTGASMTVASSYIADVSDSKNRSANFGMIGAAWGLGFIVGPMLGGLLASIGPKAPFIASALLNALNFAYGLAVLPESLPLSRRRQVRFSQMNPLASILRVLSPSPWAWLVCVHFMLFLAGQIHPVNWTLYTQTKFGWTSWQVGMSLSFVGLMIAAGHGGLTRVLIPRLGERNALTLGITINTISFLLFGLAAKGWMMYAVVVLFAFGGITMPALQSILAQHVEPERQGELQGSLVSMGSLASILAPLLYTPIFVRFTAPGAPVFFPGAAYVTASVLCGVTLALRLSMDRNRVPSADPAPALAAAE